MSVTAPVSRCPPWQRWDVWPTIGARAGSPPAGHRCQESDLKRSVGGAASVSQLYSRAYNAKDSRGRHDPTCYLLEALIKLAAAPLVSAYLDDASRGGPRSSVPVFNSFKSRRTPPAGDRREKMPWFTKMDFGAPAKSRRSASPARRRRATPASNSVGLPDSRLLMVPLTPLLV